MKFKKLRSALLAAAFSLAIASQAFGQIVDGAAGAPSQEEPACWPGSGEALLAEGGAYWLGPGDQVRITVLQRPELTGDFRVRDDGSLSLPLFGAVPAAGMTVKDLEASLTDVGLSLSGRSVSLGVEVIARRPVYAMGHIVRPGSVPFQPSMTVLKLVAMSGGLFRLTPGSNATVDVTREIARLGLAAEERKKNVARLARLQAQSEDQTELTAPDSLLRLENPQRAAELMAAEEKVLQQQEAAYQTEIVARDDAIELAEESILAMEERQERVKAQVELAQQEASRAQDLVARGLGRRGDLFTIQRIVAGLEADDRDLAARIATAKAALVNARRDRALLEINNELQLQEEINAVEGELASNELIVRYSRRIVEDLTNMPIDSDVVDPLDTMLIEVVRETKDGPQSFQGTSSTRLCPEDVVNINPANAQ